MNAALVDGIVKAVLYEGYMLYPYRPSAVKNRQRFNFGVVYPKAYGDAQNEPDAARMQTECLLRASGLTQCIVRVRFLRMIERTVGKVRAPAAELSAATEETLEKVERLEVNGKIFQPWQEGSEEIIELPAFNPEDLVKQSVEWSFGLSAKREKELIRDEQGQIVAVVFRDKSNIAGLIDLEAKQVSHGLFRLTVRIFNMSLLADVADADREDALARSLVSAHTVLEVRGGQFVSLIDPPEECREFASQCQNVKTWPVLVGEEGDLDTVLSSPIILYDYPQIAPESPGDLFDGAEIDEILSLRIMTMTDEEKQEMRESDDRARKILERTEILPEEQFMKLHGVLRGLRPGKGGTS
jgi:hydrogenase maturation protease